jgi:hypothetical protein
MLRLVRTIFFVAAVAATVQMTRCASTPSTDTPQQVKIADLVRDPAAFDGRLVIFRARVIDRISVMGVGGYRVDDAVGTEPIAVLGLSTAPAIGEETTVTGTFRMAAAFGSHQIAVVLAR